MKLREQICSIGVRVELCCSLTEDVNLAVLISLLIKKAFLEEWPESQDTRAIRKAGKLLHGSGFVADFEPGVE